MPRIDQREALIEQAVAELNFNGTVSMNLCAKAEGLGIDINEIVTAAEAFATGPDSSL